MPRTGTIQATDNPLWIGGNNPYGEYFTGLIDEVRVYNRALTQTDIQADMTTGVVPGAGDTTPPSAPTGLTATASAGQVSLSWTASTDNVGVTGYRVERCQGASCTTFAQVGTPTGTTFTDTGLAASTTYRYQVRAVDAAGNLSTYSSIATATTPAARRHHAAVGAHGALGHGGHHHPHRPGLDRLDRQRRGHRLPRRALPGSGLHHLRPGRHTDRDHLQRHRTGGRARRYRYRVRAVDAAGNLSAYSADRHGDGRRPPTRRAPSAPTGADRDRDVPTRST